MTCAVEVEQADAVEQCACTMYQYYAYLGDLYTALSLEAVACASKEPIRPDRGGMMMRYSAYSLAEVLSVH